jgi:hypothetical protein
MLITQNLPTGLSKEDRQKAIRKRLKALHTIVRKHEGVSKSVIAALKKARQDAIAKARMKHRDFDSEIKKFQAKTKLRKI